MKKLFLSLLAVMMAVICALAQGRTVKGTVFSASDGEPLIGVSVHALGTNVGVTTDFDGNFVLNVPNNASKLKVSYVGFETVEVAIASGDMVIKLKPTTILDEVMVVAYGQSKKSEYTGSASVVKADQLEDALVSSATQALTGKVSGVQVLSSNGQPGVAPTIRIRGVGSINAISTPLYVVDGMPYDGDISSINTQDIESMTILKDAASTALYGARGANGVVLITTKKGKEGEAKITFDARWGSNSRAIPNYNVINDQRTYMETIYKSYRNAGLNFYGYSAQKAHEYANANLWQGLGYQTWTAPEGQYFVGDNGKFNPYATPGYSDGQYYYIADDWIKGSFINGFRQEYNFSVNGGTDRIQYYLSAGYLGDEGLIYGSHFKRFSSRASVDYQAKKWLKIGTNVSYVYANSGYPDDQTSDASSSSGNSFAVAYGIAPVYPMYVRYADGTIARDKRTGRPIYDYGDGKSTNMVRSYMSMANPTSDLLYNTEEYLMDIMDAKVYATINPIEKLYVTGTVGYRIDNTRGHYVTNGMYGQSQASKGEVSQEQSRSRNLDLQLIANYSRTFADIHNFDIMAGYESDEHNVESLHAYGQNIYNPDVPFVDNTIDQKTGGGSAYTLSHRGFIGRLKYNYDGRYFAAFSFRRDASSRFAPENRWGSFWSASIGWDIAKENFMKQFSAIDMLKFKASFGQNGNDALGSSVYFLNAYQDQYRVTGADGVWSDGTLVFKGNREITWEKSNSFNIGFDFSFWKSMLSGTIEYYNRQTDDMLFNVPVSDSNGYTSMPMNVGSMRNNGLELELNYTPINTKNFTLDINANVTIPSNKVLKLSPSILNEYDEWITGNSYYKEGGSMYQMYLTEYAGVDHETGYAMYKAYGPLEDKEGHKLYDPINKAEIDAAQKAGTDVPDAIWDPAHVGEFDTYNWQKAYNTNRKSTGNIMPKVYGGFGANMKIYGVDFGFTFSYQAGGRIYDNTYASLMNGGRASDMGNAYHEDLLNSWTPENKESNIPAMMAESTYKYANSLSTRFLTSSNYLSLNNISLGYSFPTKLVKKLGLSELRVYGAAENVALWSKRKGLDPRQSYTASSNATYSAVRSISGGVKVSF